MHSDTAFLDGMCWKHHGLNFHQLTGTQIYPILLTFKVQDPEGGNIAS